MTASIGDEICQEQMYLHEGTGASEGGEGVREEESGMYGEQVYNNQGRNSQVGERLPFLQNARV